MKLLTNKPTSSFSVSPTIQKIFVITALLVWILSFFDAVRAVNSSGFLGSLGGLLGDNYAYDPEDFLVVWLPVLFPVIPLIIFLRQKATMLSHLFFSFLLAATGAAFYMLLLKIEQVYVEISFNACNPSAATGEVCVAGTHPQIIAAISAVGYIAMLVVLIAKRKA